jgi:hypothetical protein
MAEAEILPVEEAVEEVVEEAVDMPPHEVEARDKGWRPEEEFESKDGKQWVDAATFLDRGQFMDTISKQKKKLDKLTQDMELLKAHNAGIEKAAIERARAELKEAKAQAYTEQNGDAIVELEEREKQLTEREQAVETIQGNPFDDWIAENSWYNDPAKPELRAHADLIAGGLQAQGVAPAAIFDKVDEEVRIRFPDAFGKPAKLPSHGVASGNQGGHAAPKSKWNLLTDVQKQIATGWERDGIMTKAEYVKQLDEAGMLGA